MEGFIVGRHRHLDIAIRSCLQTELIAYTLGCLNDIICVCCVYIYWPSYHGTKEEANHRQVGHCHKLTPYNTKSMQSHSLAH